MSKSQRFYLVYLGATKPACYFAPSEHGFQIHFGIGIQPTTAFSREALEKEIESLATEGGYACFTETQFMKARKAGLIFLS